MKKKYLLLIMLSLFSLNSFGENIWIRNINIESVQASDDGKIIIFLPSGTDSFCSQKGSAFYIRSNKAGGTEDGRAAILSLALFTVDHSRQVDLLYDSYSMECYVRALKLSKSKNE